MKEQIEKLTIESTGTIDASAATLLYPPQMAAAARPTAATAYKSIFLYNLDTNKLNVCVGASYQAVASGV